MPLTHALIPAAGRGIKPYPAWDTVDKLLHPVIDSDGLAKPVLQDLADEALAAEVNQVVLVVRPGEDAQYVRQLKALAQTLGQSPVSTPQQREQAEHLVELLDCLRFVVQDESFGFGHAVWCARNDIQGDHFLLCPSDHLFLNVPGSPSCGAGSASALIVFAVL